MERCSRLHAETTVNGILKAQFYLKIYLYNVLQLDKGPVSSFSGCQIESFFVKSAISPDASHILSGSSDGNAYVWQVDRPDADPAVLETRDGEVTAVDWCLHDSEKFATSSDDLTVRFWSTHSSLASQRSFTRRRIVAPRSSEVRKLNLDARKSDVLDSPCKGPSNSNEVSCNDNPPHPSEEMPEISTPESHKRKLSSFNIRETIDKTPESALRSPSFVLYPPSSIKKKTIRDYFLGAS